MDKEERLRRLQKEVHEALSDDAFKEQTLEEMAANVERIVNGYLDHGGVEAYRVVCDETNNSQETRDQGQLNVDIFIPVDWVFRRINDPNCDPHDRLMLLDTLEEQGFLHISPAKT